MLSIGRVTSSTDNENSWRRQGQANRQNQDRASGSSTPAKEGGRQQAVSALSGNAWGTKGKGGGPAPTASTQAQAEHHTPVRNFNADEVKDFMRKSTCISLSSRRELWAFSRKLLYASLDTWAN